MAKLPNFPLWPHTRLGAMLVTPAISGKDDKADCAQPWSTTNSDE